MSTRRRPSGTDAFSASAPLSWNLYQALAWVIFRDMEAVEGGEERSADDIKCYVNKFSPYGHFDAIEKLKKELIVALGNGGISAYGVKNGKGDLVSIPSLNLKLEFHFEGDSVKSKSGRLTWDALRFDAQELREVWPTTLRREGIPEGPLPDIEDVPLCEAVSWLTFGVALGIDELTKTGGTLAKYELRFGPGRRQIFEAVRARTLQPSGTRLHDGDSIEIPRAWFLGKFSWHEWKNSLWPSEQRRREGNTDWLSVTFPRSELVALRHISGSGLENTEAESLTQDVGIEEQRNRALQKHSEGNRARLTARNLAAGYSKRNDWPDDRKTALDSILVDVNKTKSEGAWKSATVWKWIRDVEGVPDSYSKAGRRPKVRKPEA